MYVYVKQLTSNVKSILKAVFKYFFLILNLATTYENLDEGRCLSSKIFHFLLGRETLLN